MFLAKVAFGAEYDEDEIKHWLINFYRRFFGQQFKRSAMPDGQKSDQSLCLQEVIGGCQVTQASKFGWIEQPGLESLNGGLASGET